jgi:Tol biopolymer transport system component
MQTRTEYSAAKPLFGGSNPTRLTNHEDYDIEPSWSADGTKIVAVRSQPPLNTREIYVMDVDCTNQTYLTSNN